jgi:hypothetical protein
VEDYRSAYRERLQDERTLEDANRRLAAMHFGGVTIECLLKAMQVETERITDWHVAAKICPGCNSVIQPGHPQPHGIQNPGHDLMAAIQKWPRMFQRLSTLPGPSRDTLLQHLSVLKDPLGNYIDLRYKHQTPTDAEFEKWHRAFVRLEGWLRQQDQELKRRR